MKGRAQASGSRKAGVEEIGRWSRINGPSERMRRRAMLRSFTAPNRWTLSPDGRSLAKKFPGGLGDIPRQIFVYDKQ